MLFSALFTPFDVVTMLIKIRKWVTITGAFLFVVSVTYTAFTIDSNLKKEAIKKLNQRRKENEPRSSDIFTRLYSLLSKS